MVNKRDPCCLLVCILVFALFSDPDKCFSISVQLMPGLHPRMWFTGPRMGLKHWYLFKTPRRSSRAEILRNLSRFVWGWKGNSDLSPAFRLSQLSSSPWLDFWYRERCYISTVSEVERGECSVHCAKKWRVLRAAEQWSPVTPRGFSCVWSSPPFLSWGLLLRAHSPPSPGIWEQIKAFLLFPRMAVWSGSKLAYCF